MDSPENSGFNEVTGTVPMGRNPHVFQSTPRTRAQQAHGTWGADCLTGAQTFVGLGF